jgi:mannose-6-phosphate isomerase-like protein (cupin superfamily)
MKAPANLAEKLATATDRFSPRTIIATYNNNDIMAAKLEGLFHWHKHDETDDFFLVLKGTLDIELRDRTVTLNAGEVFVVPKGIEHRPVARGEVHILPIELTGTANTGDKATAALRILA